MLKSAIGPMAEKVTGINVGVVKEYKRMEMSISITRQVKGCWISQMSPVWTLKVSFDDLSTGPRKLLPRSRRLGPYLQSHIANEEVYISEFLREKYARQGCC
jgi:hypothetical protein